MRILSTVALTMVLLCGQSLFGANILLNPGFEDGALPPWANDNDFCGGCVWDVTSADSHSGTWSAEVDGNRLIFQTFAPASVAAILEVSFWARHFEGGSAMAFLFRYDDATEDESSIATSSGEWEFFDVTSSLTPGKNLVGFGVYGNSAALARFDDALVDVGRVQVPEPSTLALLGVGLGVIALRRRAIR